MGVQDERTGVLTMADIKLKNCPFCGAAVYPPIRPVIHQAEDFWQVQCQECGASVMPRRTLDLAAAAWNRRADDE